MPSSSTSISASNSSERPRIVSPPLPIRAPIFSGSILIVMIVVLVPTPVLRLLAMLAVASAAALVGIARDLEAHRPSMTVAVGERIQATVVSTVGGLTLSRRLVRGAASERQLDEGEVAYTDTQPQAVAEPAMAEMQPAIVEPAFVAAPTAMAPIDPDAETDADLTPVDGPTTEVPEDFDLSRFGPNVRAAYCGPTVDNPSLSLKHRLRKATAVRLRSVMSRRITVNSFFRSSVCWEMEASMGNSSPFVRSPLIPPMKRFVMPDSLNLRI